jgi:hypothetical protein
VGSQTVCPAVQGHHQNAYFPLFIGETSNEAEHVEAQPQLAVVTYAEKTGKRSSSAQ